MTQKINTLIPLEATNVGPAPLFMKVITTPSVAGTVGGVPGKTQRLEHYILLSVLPQELQDAVTRCIQAKIAGM